MIDKIIEELEYHKIGWENTDEYNLQRRPFIAAYEKAIETVKRYEAHDLNGYKTGMKNKEETMSDFTSDLNEEFEAVKNKIIVKRLEMKRMEGELAELEDRKTMLFGLIEKWK